MDTLRATFRLLRDRIATTGTAGRLRRIEEPNLLILTYHRVLPRTHDEWRREQPGMLVSPETLGMHLAELQIHFELVHLDDWVDARSAGRQLPRLACAVTLDDGWRDNYDFAFPVLRQNDVPATIFLVADLVGTRYAFWPNRLARALSGLRDRKDLEAWPQSLRQRLLEAGVTSAPVSAARINVAIERCKVLPDAELHSLLDMVASTMSEEGEPRDLLDWQEIRGVLSRGQP